LGLPLADVVTPDALTSAALTALLFLVLVRFLDVWEREPLWLVLALAAWGAVGAVAIAAPGNEAVIDTMSPDVAVVWGPAISAPIVEEFAKGVALVAVFFATRFLGRAAGKAEFDGVIDGVVYGATIGIGFAFAENNFYFLQQQSLEHGYEVLELREGFLNLNVLGHAVYTAAFGVGLGLATRSRVLAKQIGYAALGFGAAMLMHAVHNGLVSFLLVREYGLDATAEAFIGVPLPAELIEQMKDTVHAGETAVSILDYLVIGGLFLALLFGVAHQRKVLARELAEEIATGLITPEEHDLVTGYGRRLKLYTRMTGQGRLDELYDVRQAHNALLELAFLRSRVKKIGGDPADIDRMRRRYTILKDLTREAV
jgi:RsiW-degrading membrane proteinase PrsW (M82 family)